MNKRISGIYDSIQELSWYFGNQGFDGECCGDLSLIEFMALKKVNEKNNCAIQEIGSELNVTKSGSTKIIDRLENKGYVRRVQSSTDGRVCCVEISSMGTDVINKIFNHYVDYLSQILMELDLKSIDEISKSLQVLLVLVQKQGFIKPNAIETGGNSY